MAHDRGHIQNAAITSALHARHKGAAHQESGGQAGIDDAAEFVKRVIDQRLANVRPSIVDQDLWMAEALRDRVSHSGNVLFPRYVTGKNRRSATVPGNRIAHRFETLHITR